ncbi:hypothetical protein Tco_0782864 [Tanacetum coccineum]
MSLGKTWSKEGTEEVFTISQERPDQYLTMGDTLATNCKQLLVDVVRENMEVFTWTRSERTVVPRFVMEHKLKIYPLAELVVHKRASIFNGISVQMFPLTSKRIQPNKNGGRGRRKDWVSYEIRSILFHPHAERIKELRFYTSKDDGKGLNQSKRAERGNIRG